MITLTDLIDMVRDYPSNPDTDATLDRYPDLLSGDNHDGQANDGATYRDGGETGEVTYSMLGQRQADGSYSFHS